MLQQLSHKRDLPVNQASRVLGAKDWVQVN